MLPKVERLSRQTPEKVTVRVDARPARDLPGPHEHSFWQHEYRTNTILRTRAKVQNISSNFVGTEKIARFFSHEGVKNENEKVLTFR